ncbi:hypothetical protein K4039_06645 [Lyngbya sp. CCAP 1446/10]|uniref:hypothetical protein n=1 Tax=Lyngbya sp. CCAP 1446/10 TaxID=439293 RepID=UPI00223766B8|nr:hypothetical protein [Lyngbya sp. CCAP 1446/10]MCW6049767.1 hypothetical protein [Lyngbya sp. CCAP 1446/10]
MSDQPENNQILTQQPETIASFDADSEPAETPMEIAPAEDTLTANPEPAETPTEIAVREDIIATTSEPETFPIAAEITPATIDYENHPTQLNQTANSEPKPTRIWQILAVFLSGMLVGSVLSLGSFLAWKMYQERANIQIRLPADVPLRESPPPVPAARLNRRPGLPPAPQQTLPLTIPPLGTQTPIPSLSGVPPLASPLPNPSPSPSPAAVETPVTERVNFPAGATGTTLNNSLRANISKRYLVECNSGQSMTIKVQESQVNAAIIAPNGETIGTADSTSQWQGQLPSSGDYTIEISGDRQANYVVQIEVK